MKHSFSFHTLAEEELNEAVSYYNVHSPGLGNIFLEEMEYTINQICEYPESAPLINRIVRKKLVRRFPYSVMYSVSFNEIRILAIANQKRRPSYWSNRMQM